MGKLTITLAQIHVQTNQTAKNIEKVKRIIQELDAAQLLTPPHLILLPELWSTGFTPDLYSSAAENKEIILDLIKLSVRHHIIIGGSYINQTISYGYTNSLKLIFPHTPQIPAYNKIHLFSQMNEIDWFEAGKQPVVARHNNCKFGLSICYDLRFPELFRNYANHQVDFCLLPAQWPAKRIDHFKNLIQARAIENQFFFAAVNTVGKIGNTQFGGSSMLIDPNGQHAAVLSAHEEDLITITVDLDHVKRQRERFPVLADQTRSDHIIPNIFDTSP